MSLRIVDPSRVVQIDGPDGGPAVRGEPGFDLGSVMHARKAPEFGNSLRASTTICGERSLGVRVTRKSGAGTFRIAISRP